MGKVCQPAYDSAGNLTKDGSGCNPCWTYDYAGQLTAGNGASYLYDGVGRRQQRTDAGGTVHSFVYDGNSPYTEFIPGFARQTGGFYTYANGTTYFNRTDHLGTPRASTDYTGTVQRTEGRLMGPFGDNFTETMSNLDFTGFAGGDWDAENNGDHFGFREYAKTQGRWLTPDPAGLAAVDPANPQTWNRYAYVGNNPLSFIDPLGLWSTAVCPASEANCWGPGGAWGDGSGSGGDPTGPNFSPDSPLLHSPIAQFYNDPWGFPGWDNVLGIFGEIFVSNGERWFSLGVFGPDSGLAVLRDGMGGGAGNSCSLGGNSSIGLLASGFGSRGVSSGGKKGGSCANNGTPQTPQQTPKQQCVAQAQQTFNNTMNQINSQSIWPSVIFGASFGTLTGAAWGCFNSTFAWAMCQETWGGSALVPVVNGGISGGGAAATKWFLQQAGAMSNAQNAFQQQVNNVCSKLPG